MMDTYIRAKIDTETKNKAIKTLKSMGISVSDYIRMALIQVANKQTIPFDIIAPNPQPNELTRKTIEKSEKGQDTYKVEDAEDLFKKLCI